VVFRREKFIFVVATVEVVIALATSKVIFSLAHGVVDQWTCCALELHGCLDQWRSVQENKAWASL
jgi:hypothetical protein